MERAGTDSMSTRFVPDLRGKSLSRGSDAVGSDAIASFRSRPASQSLAGRRAQWLGFTVLPKEMFESARGGLCSCSRPAFTR
jgi:hypothetical protein